MRGGWGWIRGMIGASLARVRARRSWSCGGGGGDGWGDVGGRYRVGDWFCEVEYVHYPLMRLKVE